MYNLNRDDWIRTSGPFVPNEVRYQAAPHPATKMAICDQDIIPLSEIPNFVTINNASRRSLLESTLGKFKGKSEL